MDAGGPQRLGGLLVAETFGDAPVGGGEFLAHHRHHIAVEQGGYLWFESIKQIIRLKFAIS